MRSQTAFEYLTLTSYAAVIALITLSTFLSLNMLISSMEDGLKPVMWRWIP